MSSLRSKCWELYKNVICNPHFGKEFYSVPKLQPVDLQSLQMISRMASSRGLRQPPYFYHYAGLYKGPEKFPTFWDVLILTYEPGCGPLQGCRNIGFSTARKSSSFFDVLLPLSTSCASTSETSRTGHQFSSFSLPQYSFSISLAHSWGICPCVQDQRPFSPCTLFVSQRMFFPLQCL